MIQYKKDMETSIRTGVRNGPGEVSTTPLLPALPPNCRLLSSFRLEPGCGIGQHTHEGESEVYIITQGTLTVTEEGQAYPLCAGDVHCCFPGGTHGITNLSGEPGAFLAVIMLA